MHKSLLFTTIVFFAFISTSRSQSLFDMASSTGGISFGGFTRSGIYLNAPDQEIAVPVSFADMSLNAEVGNSVNYAAFIDLRYRYGKEYGNKINNLNLREAWAAWYTPITELKAGKQIISWSRMDIFNIQDIINPVNDLYSSFDPSDRKIANISINMKINPAPFISLQAVLIPVYKPSVLYTDFMDIPSSVKIENIPDNKYNSVSYGLRTDLNLRNLSAGFSFYDGYNLLPGIGLDSVRIQQGSESPVLLLEEKTFNIMTISADLELILGNNIVRAEALWTKPDENHTKKEYIIFPEVKWAAGLERQFGDMQVILEYSGKYIIDFVKPGFDPVLPDESSFAQLGMLPPDQLFEVLKEQIGSFNRLYKYQLEEMNHFAGLSMVYQNINSLIEPSLSIVYNISAEEILISPRIKIEPADNIDLIIGVELFKGSENSLFEMINDQLNTAFAGIRVDF